MRNEIIVEKIKLLVQTLDEIDELIATNPQEMQKVDYELSDWYHYIENNDLDDKQCVEVVKKIKALRQIRRGLNKEQSIEATYKNNSSKVMGNGTRGLLMAEIHKTVNQLDSEYKNRVITDDDIKEISEKRKVGRPKKETAE